MLLKISRAVFLIIIFSLLSVPSYEGAYSQTTPDKSDYVLSPGKPLTDNIDIEGSWQTAEGSVYPLKIDTDTVKHFSLGSSSSRTYHAYTDKVPGTKRFSYGGILNLKYFSGISYDYLRTFLPGKTISVNIHIPEGSISPYSIIPNVLRVSLKSENNGTWTEYFGGSEWTKVKQKGTYNVKIKVPEKPVENIFGQVFDPKDAILFSIEYYLMEGNTHHTSSYFSFSDFTIEDLVLDYDAINWQSSRNGYSTEDRFLSFSEANSTFIMSMGKGLDLVLSPENTSSVSILAENGKIRNCFSTISVFIPRELRRQKGTLSFTIRDNSDNLRSTVRNFDSADLEGTVFLTLSLDGLTIPEAGDTKNWTYSLRLRTTLEHTHEMMPIIFSPIKIKPGTILPFDKKWRLRIIDEKGGISYEKLPINEKLELANNDIIAARTLDNDLHNLDVAVKLSGGIDWTNPGYRIELARELDSKPLNMDNMHLEVFISPLTDTTDIWQKPFRARIGVIDENEKIMFGPNVSLSEGRPSIARLDISTTNPIPKGFVMPGFNAEKVRSIVINLEGSHEKMPAREIKLSFVNCYLTPKEYARTNYIREIDFSRFKRDPSSWVLTKMAENSGGPLIGINYPFPVIPDMPPDIMEIPQIYPCVGKKPNDKVHMGLSSSITKRSLADTFTILADNNICLVRFLLLGHLEGVFNWGERGKKIKGFDNELSPLIQKAAGLPVEKLAVFLRENEDILFPDGTIPGLEPHVLKDLLALLDVQHQIEAETGKRIISVLSLVDFTFADGITAEGPMRKYSVGEHVEIVTDPITKTKAHMIIWKLMKTFALDPRFHTYIGAVEVMNEPGNATILSTKELFPELFNYIGETLYLLKDAIGPKVPVTIGFRSWAPDLAYWSALGEGIDILLPHYWMSLESYNIDKAGLWPMEMSTDKLWEYLGTEADGRLTGMGEISPQGDVKASLLKMEKAGYSFIFLWSYSGHDGHDAKIAIPETIEYREANILSKNISETLTPEYLKKTFQYIKAAKTLFDSKEGIIKNRMPEHEKNTQFDQYLTAKKEDIPDPVLKDSIGAIQEIMRLKNMSYANGDINFLILRLSDLMKKLSPASTPKQPS